MPLKLELKTGDRIIINGAVIEAITSGCRLLVHNQAAILRTREVMTEDQAVTPATRVYFALQNAYLFSAHKEVYMDQFYTFLEQYAAACPSAKMITDHIRSCAEEDKLYGALKETQRLIIHQREILNIFENNLFQIRNDEEDEEDTKALLAFEGMPEDNETNMEGLRRMLQRPAESDITDAETLEPPYPDKSPDDSDT